MRLELEIWTKEKDEKNLINERSKGNNELIPSKGNAKS